MHQSITESIILWIISQISQGGYPIIFLLMAIESALIPIPSEVIMPFSGFLVGQGRFNLWIVIIIGALGNLCGSWAAYALGYWGEKKLIRRFVVKYGKFILLTEEDFDQSLSLFKRFGQWATAVSRVIPGVRTVISLPAGMSKVSLWKFSVLTFFGSFIWSALLTLIGVKLGQNWEIIRPYFQKFDILIVVFVIILIAAYIYFKLRKNKLSAHKA